MGWAGHGLDRPTSGPVRDGAGHGLYLGLYWLCVLLAMQWSQHALVWTWTGLALDCNGHRFGWQRHLLSMGLACHGLFLTGNGLVRPWARTAMG